MGKMNKMGKKIVALAGQPNCGKSTVFNSLTGARQFVANYPGVTVDKMMGWYRRDGESVEVVDLPGTYSLTSYSPEERVSRGVLLGEPLSAVVNVMDAANLKRSLYLTIQLLEMEIPLVLDLNMMDVAENLGITVDAAGLSKELGVPVIGTAITQGRGREDLLRAIADMSRSSARTSLATAELYPDLKDALRELEALLAGASLGETFPLPWIAVKLMEADPEVAALVREKAEGRAQEVLLKAEALREHFEREKGMSADLYVSGQRSRRAAAIAGRHVVKKDAEKVHISERIDRAVCNKFFGPVFLLVVIYGFYYLSFIQGYNLTHYTWPVLAGFRSLAESVLPQPGLIELPLLREFVLWIVDNLNALFNYIPIFFILFALIAVLEDSGYMPRIAFVLDRILSRFGLHGQSTLPMILGCLLITSTHSSTAY